MPKSTQKTSKRHTRKRAAPSQVELVKLSRDESGTRGKKYIRRYTEKNYREMAAALGVLVARVRQQARCFEGAGLWYLLDKNTPRRSTPTDLQKQLSKIQNAADRLLAHLGIDAIEASDGPGNPDVFDVLALANADGSEDVVAEATGRVGWLLEFFEAVAATVELSQLALQAKKDVTLISKGWTLKGHHGDRALNLWTLRMLGIHKWLTGVNAHRALGREQADRLYGFLAAAGRPLSIKCTRAQWKEHVNTVDRSYAANKGDFTGRKCKPCTPPKKRHGQVT